ncbi:integrase [Gossypium australe]|uniref:Integrase n=1 Tax=Gossypium australe TaxID=47621 RepID=A0A5B6WFS4_9ROSI|nr:integrase [Gossypium australe]
MVITELKVRLLFLHRILELQMDDSILMTKREQIQNGQTTDFSISRDDKIENVCRTTLKLKEIFYKKLIVVLILLIWVVPRCIVI